MLPSTLDDLEFLFVKKKINKFIHRIISAKEFHSAKEPEGFGIQEGFKIIRKSRECMECNLIDRWFYGI